MKLLMVSGDRSVLQGKKSAFYYTLEEFSKHWERIDVICPRGQNVKCPSSGRAGKMPARHSLGDGGKNEKFFGKVYFHSSSFGLWYQPWWILKKGKALVAEHHHDVMTVHEYPPFYNGIGAYFLHKKTSIPYALEIHHIVGYPHAASVKEFLGRLLYRPYFFCIGRNANAVRAVNFEVKEVLERWGIKNIRVIFSFYLDREALQPDSSIKKTYDVVFCGKDIPNKGLQELRIATDRLGVTLLAIGADMWLETKEDVYQSMQSGKVFVMNSKSEGGPRVLLEAMALGLPVISTRVGIAPYVIQDGVNGIFTTGDPSDLERKIKMLLNDEDLRARLGREACKIGFDRAILVQSYAQFLQSLV